MRNWTFSIVLLALAALLGGCIIEPADTYPDEEATGSSSEAVCSSAQDEDRAEATGEVPGTLENAVQTGATVGPNLNGRMNYDPTKPQPDPWDGLRLNNR